MKLLIALCLASSCAAQCANKLAGGEHLVNIEVGSMNRDLFLMVPQKSVPGEARPGVVAIHGCGSSPERFEMESALNVETAQREWFNVYPKGTGSSRLGWNAGNGACATGGIPNDVDFMRAVVLYMIEETCVDVNRVFAAGFSNGGQMTYNLTCTMTDTFAGFSGTGMSMASSFYPAQCGVANADVKPMLQVCGTTDFACSSGNQQQWFDMQASAMGCTGSATTTTLSSTSVCKKYSTCGPNNNEPLESCIITGLGHCWSGNDCCDSQCLNQNPANMDSSNHILDFFSEISPRSTETRTEASARLRKQLAHTTVKFNYKGLSNSTQH
jgi:polyhydroxybutyrate depolymerase